MTSNKSSINPTAFTFKGGLKSAAIAPIVTLFTGLMFLVVALGSASLFMTYVDEKGVLQNNSINFKYLFFDMPQVYSVALPILIAGAGGLTSILLFKFITAKKTVNVYYSLGIKRENLFLSRYFAGALLLSAAIIIPFTIMFFVNVAACGYSSELLNAFVYLTVSFLAICLTAFSVTSAVFGAVGTAFETTLFSAIILFLPSVFFYSLQALMDKFLYGNPYGTLFYYADDSYYSISAEALTDTFSFVNPLFFNAKSLALYSVMGADGKTNIRLDGENLITASPSFLAPALWLLVAGLIALVGVKIFKKRKAEICGFIGMNKYLNTVGVFVAAFFAFCLSISFLNINTVADTIIGVVLFAVLYIGLELLILRDTRKFKKGLVKLPAELALCGIAIAVFSTGLFGFSQRLPKKTDIKEAQISFGGVNDEYGFAAEDNYFYYPGVSYGTNGLIVGGFESEKDIQAVLDIHKEISENSAAYGEQTNTVNIVYKLKNGKTFKRSFYGFEPKCYEQLLKLEKSDNYKKRLNEVFKGTVKTPDSKSTEKEIKLFEVQTAIRNSNTQVEAISSHLNETAELNLTAENREKLVNCLYSDLLKRSVEEKYYPESSSIVYLAFHCYGYFDGTSYQVSDMSDGEEATPVGEITYYNTYESSIFSLSQWDTSITIAVTDGMESTVKFLKELGVYDRLISMPEYTSAEYVKVEDYILPENIKGYPRNLFFKGIYTSTEVGMDNSGSELIFENGTKLTDIKDIKRLAENSFAAYQCDKGNGYFVAFYKGDTTRTVAFIPGECAKAAGLE